MYLAICDDQAEELATVTTLLDQWQRDRNTSLRYQVFQNASKMLDAAENERFSLYLLDVMMPGMNGLAAAREIRGFDDTAAIVFLTSSPEFAYESYGVHSLDYLLKPIRADMFFRILDRLYLQEQKPLDGLSLKSGSTWIRVRFSQLEYVEVMSKHLYFNLIVGFIPSFAFNILKSQKMTGYLPMSLAVFLAIDQASVFHYFHVLRNSRFRDSELLGKRSDTMLSFQKSLIYF